MESGDCDRIGPYTIDDTDILQVYASPPQIPGGSATRDSCVIEVRTAPNRRLRIYVMDVTIFDCGTRVYIYDGGTHMTTPTVSRGGGNVRIQIRLRMSQRNVLRLVNINISSGEVKSIMYTHKIFFMWSTKNTALLQLGEMCDFQVSGSYVTSRTPMSPGLAFLSLRDHVAVTVLTSPSVSTYIYIYICLLLFCVSGFGQGHRHCLV